MWHVRRRLINSMKINAGWFGVVLAATVTLSSMAGARLDDPAAPLSIKEWVKGKAVDVKDGKNIYVVEFWATWCPPCRTSIPHLTEMQKKFKDKGVVMIGVSDETVEKVKPFVTEQGEKMEYVVACDDGRATSDGYMTAYGQGGIPHAFIVSKEGKVIWHGHPMDGLDTALEQILDGKYDMQAAIQKDEARALLAEYQELSGKGDAKAVELGKKLIASAGNDEQALCDFAFGIVTNMRNKNRDFALADEALNKAEKVAGAKTHRTVGTRSIVRFESGKQDEGIALAKEAAGLAKEEKDRKRYENYLKVMESRKAKASAPAK